MNESEEKRTPGEEDGLLRAHGFHLAYDPEDAAEHPREFPERGEVWQLGPDSSNVFTRGEALRYIKEGNA